VSLPTDEIIAWVEERTPGRSDVKLERLSARVGDTGHMMTERIERAAIQRAYFPLLVYRAVYRRLGRHGRSLGLGQPVGTVLWHFLDDVLITRGFRN